MKINERFPSELLAVLTHFYRGEIHRVTVWRRRLDTTTNWAIIAMTATFSWSFSDPSTPPERTDHIIFLFTSWTVFLLMCIEARRYRYLDVWRTRVRMLEVHLLMPALNPELDIVQGDWRAVLSNDLLQPSYKISFLEGVATRLRANYLWIFAGLLAGWVIRVYIAATETDVDLTWAKFYTACGYGKGGAISPLLVIGAFALFWVLLLGILLATSRQRHVTGEIRRRDRRAKQWPI